MRMIAMSSRKPVLNLRVDSREGFPSAAVARVENGL